MADHRTNDSNKENDFISTENHGANCLVNSFLQTLCQTSHSNNVVHHTPTATNNMPHGSIPAGSNCLLFKFQFGDNSVTTKEWTKSFRCGIVDLFLQHFVQELNMGTVQEGKIRLLFDGHDINYSGVYVNYKSSRMEFFIEAQNALKGCHDVYIPSNKYAEVRHLECDGKHENNGLQVGQLPEVSSNAQADLNLLPTTELELDLHPLHPEKSKEDVLLFFEPYSPENEELCSVGILSVKDSGNPLKILTKENKMSEFMPYEGVELRGAGIEFVFAAISNKYCQEPSFGAFHLRIQLCKQLCRIMRSCGLAIQERHLCCSVFRASPKLLPLSGLQFFSRKDKHAHPLLTETAASGLPELLKDILMDIFALLEIPDLLRAASVCSSWNAAYSSVRSIGHCRRPQTPCLIYTSESAAGENVACLYSLAEKRAYRLTHLEPPIHKRYLIGSSHGWLVTADERSEMHLVNPVTGEQIALPSVITIEQVTPLFDDSGVICKYQYSPHTAQSVTGPSLALDLGMLRNYLQHKALLFYDTSAGSYIVVLIHGPWGQLSFARLGDEKWTWLPPHINFEDCIYKDGLLYAVTTFGEIIAFDLSRTVPTSKIIMGRAYKRSAGERVYIAQAPWGDLLQVRRPLVLIREQERIDEHGHSACAGRASTWKKKVRMEIYKVCTATKKLVEINSLADHVLFLGHNRSQCSRAEEYPQLKPNHIYFTDDSTYVYYKPKLGFRLVIGVLNFENKSVEEIIWPRPWSNCMAPLLIIPNLGMLDSACRSLRI